MPEPSPPLACRLPERGLPLTSFEEHMLCDDRPSHPMAIVTRFDFVDDPPPAHLEEAFHETLKAEPLLTARVTGPAGGRRRWVPGSAVPLAHTRVADVAEGPVQWTGPLPRLDPEAGPMLHAALVEHDAGWSILMAVHHAAADGLGIIGFLERWLLAVEGKRSRWRRRPEDVMAALAGRGRIASSWRQFGRMLPRLAKGLEGVREFMKHDVLELGASSSGDRTTPPLQTSAAWHPLIMSATLEEHAVRGLEAAAKRVGVGVNDLLATGLVATLGAHMAAAPPLDASTRRAAQERIRLAIPISLRTKNDHVLPAANRVSMVFLDRQPDDRHDRGRLAAGIRDQMEIIHAHALEHIFPLSLGAARLLPGGLSRTAERPRPQCTAVFSNVGRFFQRSPLADATGVVRIGGGRMAGWWGVPPIRPGTALAVGTHETAGRRTLTFHVDRDRLPPHVARDLLTAVSSEVESLAITAPPGGPGDRAGAA